MASPPESPAVGPLAELGLKFDPQINYKLDSMFPKASGWGAKGEMKAKHKLVVNIEPLLKRMLQDGEEVHYVAKGVQYKFSEQYFLGVWAALINQTVFVLTNLRLIMLHTNTSGRPRETYWVIYYNQIKKFKGSWIGQVALNLHDGTKLKFTAFKGNDRKQMPAIFEQAFESYQQYGFNPQVTQSRENLCNNCLQVVPKNQYTCAHCDQVFWKPSEVALRSLVFPSWGDFVMGHTSLACVELLGYCVSWLILLVMLVGAAGEVEALIGVGVFLVFIIGFQHCVDAGLTYFIARKGLTPKRRRA